MKNQSSKIIFILISKYIFNYPTCKFLNKHILGGIDVKGPAGTAALEDVTKIDTILSN
jgi:hypothetical protein